MKMINLLKLFILFFGLTLVACEKAPEEVTDVSTLRLVWNSDPTTTASLVWDGKTKTDATVYYGEKDRGRRFKKYSYSKKPYRTLDYYDMNTRYVKLENLKPDHAYYFVIKDSEGVSKRYWFRTAPDQQKAFTFVAGGDTKSSGDALEAGRSSNRVVAALRPLFVLFSGDITSGNGTDPENWKRWLTDWSTLTTTADGRLIPIVQVQGNHEGGNMANLNIIFDTPFQQNDSSSIYYSWSLGGDFFHLITLNSQIEQGGKQREWLENDLITHQTYTFKVAAYHKPIWPHTSRKRENEYLYKQWAFLFYKYGLDISFDADSHMHKITYPLKPDSLVTDTLMGFIRDDQNGTMYIGEGSWGAHPRANDDDKPWTMASGSFNQFKWLQVYPQGENSGAHIKIYTVITADYDKEGKLHTYFEGIEPLNENNLFSVPKGLKIFQNEKGKDFVSYPFH
jgi:hypothetical protein